MKIAIAGYGLEGKASLNYWSKIPGSIITVADERDEIIDVPAGVPVISGKGAFEKLQGFDLVIRTAGLSPDKIKTDGKVWSATNEFFVKCPAPIIGVTGTKGKGTTASFIASIFEAAGKKVWLVGNIGMPALEVLNEIEQGDIVIYELSSFQLWDAQKSPHVAVVLGIESEHLDVHTDFNDYLQAKAHIRRHQTAEDVCIYKSGNEYAEYIAASNQAPKQAYGLDAVNGSHVKDGHFYINDQIICSTSEVQLKGEHNIDNACAAVAVTHWLGVSNDAIAEGLRNFKGLDHRLQYIRTVGGVAYYNDSIATTPSAAIAALKSFSEPVIMILGGSSKEADFSELAKEIASRKVYGLLVGAEASGIASSLQAVGFNDFELCTGMSMAQVVDRASTLAGEGSVVLLSPACASFGDYKDYQDRGNQFSDAVRSL